MLASLWSQCGHFVKLVLIGPNVKTVAVLNLAMKYSTYGPKASFDVAGTDRGDRESNSFALHAGSTPAWIAPLFAAAAKGASAKRSTLNERPALTGRGPGNFDRLLLGQLQPTKFFPKKQQVLGAVALTQATSRMAP